MAGEGPIDLVRQVRAHLESLRSAGVLLVPRGTPISIPELRLVPAQADAPARLVAVPDDPAPADPLESRQIALDVLRTEVAACDKCSELFSTRTQTVFGTGPLDPEVLFVGEAPGSAEDAQGEPFVGKDGQLLRRIIAACQLTSSQAYLMNIIKCRPPKNRTPAPTECANCRDFFRRQFEVVKPKHVVALGQTAARLLTGRNEALANLRGTVHRYRGVPLICTVHPSEIGPDQNDPRRRECWEDMKLLMRTMGREVRSGQ
jgi:DNA polymerase